MLRSLLHFLHDRVHLSWVANAVLDVLAELPPAPEPSRKTVVPEAEAVAAAFLARLFGDEYLEGLRLRETVARFIVVSQIILLVLDSRVLLTKIVHSDTPSWLGLCLDGLPQCTPYSRVRLASWSRPGSRSS